MINLPNVTEYWRIFSNENLSEVYEGELIIEEWKSIVGYEHLYEISSFGRVKSNGVIKAQNLPKNGYLLVSLWKSNKEKKALVHRLVADAFLQNPDEKKTVNHKKGIKADNRAHQLEWMTQGENASHSYSELGRASYMVGKTGKDCRFSRPVNQLDLSDNFIAKHESITLAAKSVGTSRKNISHAVNGDQRTAVNFKWEYA